MEFGRIAFPVILALGIDNPVTKKAEDATFAVKKSRHEIWDRIAIGARIVTAAFLIVLDREIGLGRLCVLPDTLNTCADAIVVVVGIFWVEGCLKIVEKGKRNSSNGEKRNFSYCFLQDRNTLGVMVSGMSLLRK